MTVAVPFPVAYRPSIGWSLLVQYPGVLVGEDATAGADVAGHDLDCVVGRLVDGSQARVHPVVGIAERTVVGGLTSPVVGVDAEPAFSLNRSIVSDKPAGSMSHMRARSARVHACFSMPLSSKFRGNRPGLERRWA